MASKAAHKRLTKEYLAIQKNPPPYVLAKPLESNILEWHYVIRGPPDTPYYNGEYHGVLLFPQEYPFKPPSIRMTTPSGRFQPDARLCLSMSDFHPSSWNPAWSVATILNGLLSFMCSEEATTGSIKTTDADKRIYASRSHTFNLNDGKFRDIFPDLCTPETVHVDILYPLNGSSSKQIQLQSQQPAQINNKPLAGATARHMAGQRRELMNRAPRPNGARGQNVAANLAAQQNANVINQNAGQRRLFDQWRKWGLFLLVCLYLVIVKLLSRSSEAVSGSDRAG